MTRRDEFEALFTANPDPWDFRRSPYEAAKFDATIGALGDRRFDYALDLGCANGVLTARLAARCRRVLAVDVADAALQLARSECAAAGHRNVDFQRADIPAEWPDRAARVDLIVVSEFLYFIDAKEIGMLAQRIADAAKPAAMLVTVNTTAAIATGLSGAEAEGLLARGLAARGWAAPLHRSGGGWRMAQWAAP